MTPPPMRWVALTSGSSSATWLPPGRRAPLSSHAHARSTATSSPSARTAKASARSPASATSYGRSSTSLLTYAPLSVAVVTVRYSAMMPPKSSARRPRVALGHMSAQGARKAGRNHVLMSFSPTGREGKGLRGQRQMPAPEALRALASVVAARGNLAVALRPPSAYLRCAR